MTTVEPKPLSLITTQTMEMVERARAAQPAWAALPARERARLLRRWGEALWRDQAALIKIICAETGKTHSSALAEIAVLDNTIDWVCRHAPRVSRPQRRRSTFPVIQRGKVVYHPYPVVGFITPWNYPLLNGLQDVVAALAVGCAAVIKPSEDTPRTMRTALERLYEVGVPTEIAGMIEGAAEAGEALIDQVDFVAFTGSSDVGRSVAARAAARMIPYTLELGGKGAMIVLNDADLDLAASWAVRGAFENAGQACVAVERVYAEADIHDAFVARLLDYAGQLTLGAGDAHMGCLAHEREFLRAQTQIEDALTRGAVIRHGGKARPDIGATFLEPTILTGVDHSMRVMREETFAPLLPVMRVRDADEAVRLANDSDFGLSASIFTRNLRRGERLAARLECGDVTINRALYIFAAPSLPMGGRKLSGIGRRNGVEGMLRFLQPQSILTDSGIGNYPTLRLTDPLTMTVYKALRFLRRWS